MANEKERFNVFKAVTQKIVMRLAQGDIPWRKRWCSPVAEKMNYVSRKSYRGVNLLLLEEPGEYMTVKQANDVGGKIRKGEHGTLVLKWIPFIPKDKKEEAERLEKEGLSTEHLKAFKTGWDNVFHLSQTEGIASKIETADHHAAEKPTDKARFVIDRFLETHGVQLREKAVNDVTFDEASGTVTVPERRQYNLEEEWYGSVFSGLMDAMQRYEDEKKQAPSAGGDAARLSVREELVNEIGSAMCLSAVGLDNRRTNEDTAAECARWTNEFNKDYTLVVHAASAAERMAREILEPILA